MTSRSLIRRSCTGRDRDTKRIGGGVGTADFDFETSLSLTGQRHENVRLMMTKYPLGFLRLWMLSCGSKHRLSGAMAYIYRQIEGGIDQEQGEALLQAVREIEIEGSPTDLIGVRFRPGGDGISPRDIGRAENWRDLPVQERTALYWREGKQVRLEQNHVKLLFVGFLTQPPPLHLAHP